MLSLDTRTVQALHPWLERVVIADPSPAASRLLIDLLHNIRPSQIWTAATSSQALGLLEAKAPQMIFTEFSGESLDGIALTRRIRRSDYLCRKAPVIMVTSQATPGTIMAARDAGVHEFLRKPFTFKDLVRRLEAVTLHKRGWVEAIGYVGPDRRRFNSAAYKGSRKRRTDAAQTPEQAQLVQALKILTSAVSAIDSDPRQAFRSLSAQADDLKQVGEALDKPELVKAARALQQCLADAGSARNLSRASIEPLARGLLVWLPKTSDAPARTAA